MKRLLLWLGLGVPLLLSLVLVLLLGTPVGTRALLGAVVPLVPGLSIGASEGRIWSTLELADLRYETAAIGVQAQRLELSWQPAALLRRELRIAGLRLQGVTVTLPPAAEGVAAEPVSEGPITLPLLPLVITLESGQVTDFELQDAAGATTLQLHRTELSGAWTASDLALEVQALDLETAALRLATSGPLELRMTPDRELANATLDSELSYRLLLAESPWAPFEGSLTTRGPVGALDLSHTLDAPYASTLTGTLTGLPAVPDFDLELAFTALDPARMRADWPAGALTAELQAHGAMEDWRVELRGQGQAVERWEGELSAALRGSSTAAELDSLVASTSFGRLAASGTLSWQSLLAADLALTLSDFNPVEFAADWPGQIDGTVMLTTRWPQPQELSTLSLRLAPVTVSGDLRGAPLGGELALSVEGSRLSVAEGSELRWGDNQLLLSGYLDDQGSGTLSLAPKLNDLTLIPGSDLRGQIAGTLNLTGALRAPNTSGQLQLREFSGAGVAVADAELAWVLRGDSTAEQELTLRVETLSSGTTRLERAQVQLKGPLADHQIAVNAADAQGTIDLQWRGHADGLPTSQDWLQRLGDWWTTGGTYRWVDPTLQLTPARGAPWQLQSGAGGSATAAAVQLAQSCFVPVPEVAVDGSGSWRAEPGRFCLEGARTADGAVRVGYTVDGLAMQLLEPWLDPAQQLSGRLQGKGDLRLPDPLRPAFEGRAALELSGLELRLQGYDPADSERKAKVLSLDVGSIVLTGDGQQGALALKFPLTIYDPTESEVARAVPGVSATTSPAAPAEADDIRLPALLDGQLTMDLTVPDWSQVGLTGALALNVESLSFLSALSAEVTAASGALRGNMQIAGSLAEPALDGSLQWRQGTLSLLTPGLELKQIELALTPGATPDSFDLQASLASGRGTLAVAGRIDLAGEAQAAAGRGQAGPRGSFTVTGDRAVLANTAEVRLLASPNLTIEYVPDRLTVRGAVEVPEASIALQQFPPAAVVSSRDAVVIRESATGAEREPEQALAVDAELKLILGEQVSFSGFGLDTRMTGELAVRQRPGRAPTGRGEIKLLDGQFRAYAQNLAIERGVAIWTNSPIAEPGIDLRAYRLPRPDIKVGVHARGPLSQPRTELFSEPSMTESDQLSYLVLGRPLENNSSSEQSLLSQAALALGIRGGNFLTNQFGDKLGVDDIGIETEAGAGAEQAAFVVGKYLSPAIYVSYGVGLLDAVSRLKLEYFLSQHWTLQTESSTVSSGGDLIYSIERK